MLVFLLSYIISALITFIILQKFKYKAFPLPKLKLSKSGINFYSTKNHKIKVSNAKIISINNGVFVKTEKEIIVFKNVKNIILRNEHMYFYGCGKVDIVFNSLNYSRYFNFKIISKDLSNGILKINFTKELYTFEIILSIGNYFLTKGHEFCDQKLDIQLIFISLSDILKLSMTILHILERNYA
mgnify:CR=1 FL=1